MGYRRTRMRTKSTTTRAAPMKSKRVENQEGDFMM